MAHRISKSGSDSVLVDSNTHPQTMSVLRTRMEPIGISVVEASIADMNPVEAMEFMKNHMENTLSNEEFLVSMNS